MEQKLTQYAFSLFNFFTNKLFMFTNMFDCEIVIPIGHSSPKCTYKNVRIVLLYTLKKVCLLLKQQMPLAGIMERILIICYTNIHN